MAERPMSKDWDFVTMSDYQADMKESGDRAAGIIEMQAREITGLKVAIGAIVHAVGKPVSVSYRYLADLEPRSIIVEADPANDTFIFRPDTGRAGQ